MKLLKSITTSLITVIESTTKAVDKNVPNVGEALYHSTAMVNNAVKNAREELLMEQANRKAELTKEYKLNAAQLKQIEAELVY